MATVFLANHANLLGTYQVHTYATAGNGVPGNLAARTATMSLPATSFTANVASNQMTTTLRVSGGFSSLASSVVFPVWNNPNQADLRWYQGVRQADGSWQAQVPITNHRLAGRYTAQAHAVVNGAPLVMGGTTFNISAFTPTVAIQNNTGTKFDVVVRATTPSGLSSVTIAVWSTANQSNLVFYPANRRADGSFMATVFLANHANLLGTYQVHTYSTAGNGVPGNMVATTSVMRLNSMELNPIDEVIVIDEIIEVIDEIQEPIGVDLPKPPVSDSPDIEIIGQSGSTVDQMVSFFNASDGSYPSGVYDSLGAATIEEFCSLIFEEAELEGVKAEVLFAQVMKETDWLRFTEAVKPEQCNFGGLGITDAKPEGDSFVDVRAGLRVQVQLLKYFASEDALENTCESVLWEEIAQLYGRGSAPNLADLSEKWANSVSDYGDDLMVIVRELLAYQQ